MEAGPEKLLPQKIEAQDRLIRFAKGQMQNEKLLHLPFLNRHQKTHLCPFRGISYFVALPVCQISFAYSSIARSAAKRPAPLVFIRDGIM